MPLTANPEPVELQLDTHLEKRPIATAVGESEREPPQPKPEAVLFQIQRCTPGVKQQL